MLTNLSKLLSPITQPSHIPALTAGFCTGRASLRETWAPPDGTATGINIFNSLTGTKVPLVVANKPADHPGGNSGVLQWYMCGPTVYDWTHIGHARTYVAFDGIIRIAKHVFGVDTWTVSGLTDVDDKILAKASATGESPQMVARHWEAVFRADMAALGVTPPAQLTRVTEHMDEIIDFVRAIEDNGFAYQTDSGVYFDSSAWGAARTGLLVPSRADLSGDQGGDTPLLGDKRAQSDFALWKTGPAEASWDSPWGIGRPGWHIECSAMASHALGHGFDVHSGGIDLAFPHHENELCQSHAAHPVHSQGSKDDGDVGPLWVNYFLHSGHVTVSGLKMSKSLKNFITVQDVLDPGGEWALHPSTLRLWALQHHYRSRLEVSAPDFARARDTIARWRGFLSSIDALKRSSTNLSSMYVSSPMIQTALATAQRDFKTALADDFDTPTALAAVDALLRATRGEVAAALAGSSNDVALGPLSAVGEWVSWVTNQVLGIPTLPSGSGSGDGDDGGKSRDDVVDALVEFRSRVRASKGDKPALFKACDELRDETAPALGIDIQDTANGSTWKHK